MRIVNTIDGAYPHELIGYARQLYSRHLPNINRPSQKTHTYPAAPGTGDSFVIIVTYGVTPDGDSVRLINTNRFRITRAINEVIGDQYFPTLSWSGGTAPFVIKLAYRSVDGLVQTFDTTGMSVNINTNLTDGTGDIVLAGALREYIVTKKDDSGGWVNEATGFTLTTDGWWADDLEIYDGLAGDAAYDQKHQNALGILIEDSLVPTPRTLFAPFAPNPTYEPDLVTPKGLFAKYPDGRFGPPTWCIPTILWEAMPSITYGAVLSDINGLTATVHIPGTTDPLPGAMSYWLDAGYTVPATGTAHDVDSGLPVYATFLADDTLHYHLAAAENGIIINQAVQLIDVVRLWRNDDPYFIGSNPVSAQRSANQNLVGDKFMVVIYHARVSGDPAADLVMKHTDGFGNEVYLSGAVLTPSASTNAFTFTVSGGLTLLGTAPYIHTITSANYKRSDDVFLWDLNDGLPMAVYAEVQITSEGPWGLTVSVAGNTNWTAANYSVSDTATHATHKDGDVQARAQVEAVVGRKKYFIGDVRSKGRPAAGDVAAILYVSDSSAIGSVEGLSYHKVSIVGSIGSVGKSNNAARRRVSVVGSVSSVAASLRRMVRRIGVLGSVGAVGAPVGHMKRIYTVEGGVGAVCDAAAVLALVRKREITGAVRSVGKPIAVKHAVFYRDVVGLVKAAAFAQAVVARRYVVPRESVITPVVSGPLTYGDPISKVLTATAVPSSGSWVFDPVLSTTSLPVGTHLITIYFTPYDTSYLSSTAGATITVEKAPAVIEFPFPDVTLHQTYDGEAKYPPYVVKRNGVITDAVVSFEWDNTADPTTAPVNAGVYGFTATVIDSRYYGVAEEFLAIERALTTVTWKGAKLTYGTQLSAAHLNAVGSVPGTKVYYQLNVRYFNIGDVLPAGVYLVEVQFLPTDSQNYETSTTSGTITVDKALPVITWATPAAIMQGTALSSLQLNATANVPGTFVYNHSIGQVLAVGTYQLVVTFTPTDIANYTQATKIVNLTVTANPSTLRITEFENNLTRAVHFAGGRAPYSAKTFGEAFNVGFYPMTTSYFQISPLNPSIPWCGTGGVRLTSGDGQYVNCFFSSYPAGAKAPQPCPAAVCMQGVWVGLVYGAFRIDVTFTSCAASGTCTIKWYVGGTDYVQFTVLGSVLTLFNVNIAAGVTRDMVFDVAITAGTAQERTDRNLLLRRQ